MEYIEFCSFCGLLIEDCICFKFEINNEKNNEKIIEDRNIREKQEKEYLKSLKIDQEKLEKENLEKEKQEKEKQEEKKKIKPIPMFDINDNPYNLKIKGIFNNNDLKYKLSSKEPINTLIKLIKYDFGLNDSVNLQLKLYNININNFNLTLKESEINNRDMIMVYPL